MEQIEVFLDKIPMMFIGLIFKAINVTEVSAPSTSADTVGVRKSATAIRPEKPTELIGIGTPAGNRRTETSLFCWRPSSATLPL